jgi:hypothetical protein
MCRQRQLNLDDLPWPLSLLKFDQAVYELRAGDDMIATVKDREIVGNLRRLLCSQPDLCFHVIRTDRHYYIKVTKKVPME